VRVELCGREWPTRMGRIDAEQLFELLRGVCSGRAAWKHGDRSARCAAHAGFRSVGSHQPTCRV